MHGPLGLLAGGQADGDVARGRNVALKVRGQAGRSEKRLRHRSPLGAKSGVQRGTTGAGRFHANAIVAGSLYGRASGRLAEDPDPGSGATYDAVRVAAVPPYSESYRGLLCARVETAACRIGSDQWC